MKIVCYYHNDPDGIISGAVVKKKYHNEDIELIKVDYDMEIDFLGKEHGFDKCILVDFSFTPDVMQKLYESYGEDFIWIDHHISAIEKVGDLNNKIAGIRVAEEKKASGCGLTWTYYFPDTEVPNIVKWVEDIDLWKFKYKETKPFIAGLMLLKPYPDSDFVLEMMEEGNDVYQEGSCCHEEEILKNGKILNDAQLKRVKSVIKNGKEIDLHGYRCLAINCPVDDSMLGNYACKVLGYDVGLIWRVKQDYVTVGLRSNSDDIKVNEIARKYGGGGHIRASGFNMPLRKFIATIYDTLGTKVETGEIKDEKSK